MNILAIDIGSYSIKLVEVKTERRNLLLVDQSEIILEEMKAHYPNAQSIKELQKEIVANYIQKKPNDIRIIFQIPNELITTRFLEIPGNNKRKTEQMIPFQLDENLPYSLNQAHFSSRLLKKASGFSILSNITQLNIFKDYISFYESKDAQPTTLTSEISAIGAYVDYVRMNESCCILDIGHRTTKAYFITNRQVVSNHTSYIAGSQINDVISRTYQISLEDSILYKHENAYFLTDEQMQEVSEDQKEFALLMKQLFLPLILDFKRWEIGHRVKFGHPIEKIYIMGGSSQINGLDLFLNFHTGLKVGSLQPISEIKNDYNLHDKSFFLAKMIAYSEKSPSSIINFLTGKFQINSNSYISSHSAMFIWLRTTSLAFIILFGLIFERYFYLIPKEKELDKTFSSMAKKEAFITKKERKEFSTNPQNVLSSFKKKNKIIKDEVSTIYSSQNANALKPLAVLSQTLKANPKVSLEKFQSDGYNVEAIFSTSEVSELELLEKHLRRSGLSQLKTKLDQANGTLKVNFAELE